VLFTLGILLSLILTPSCSEEGVKLSDLPEAVAAFITKYYPGVAIDRFGNSANTCVVGLRDSATLTFDGKRQWTIIDGNGATLPQILVYDQTPEELYAYLEEIEATNGVYKLERAKGDYGVWLYDSYFEYYAASGEIEYKPMP
nr:hypothetical protein [Muribaculaceae bacterium]